MDMKVPSRIAGKLPHMVGGRIVVLGLTGGLLAGCGGETAEARLKANVRYEKSGGFAGLSQRLTVRPDGTGVARTLEARRAFKVTAATRRTIERAVRAARLARTRDPRPTGQGADGFEFGVAYGPHKVDWSDFTADPPERVERLYTLLDELYERYAPSS
jgi:hypothetical protein